MNAQKKRYLIIAVLTAIVFLMMLTSCTASLRMGTKADQPTTQALTVSQDVECRIYIRQGYLALPPLPDLSKEKNLTSEELNIIQANYIKLLRTFILDERARLDEAYTKYVRRCLR